MTFKDERKSITAEVSELCVGEAFYYGQFESDKDVIFVKINPMDSQYNAIKFDICDPKPQLTTVSVDDEVIPVSMEIVIKHWFEHS